MNPSSDSSRGNGRRDFLRNAGILALTPLLGAPRVFADAPAPPEPLESLAPSKDKHLTPDRIASLFARGEPSVWRTREERRYLGIPAGGIGSGTVYLGADGRLWCWDIFNAGGEGVVPNNVKGPEPDSGKIRERDGSNYVAPSSGKSPWNIDNGFRLKFADGSVRELADDGFSRITCTGSYPAPVYDYADDASPVAARLEAVSPFIPLDYDTSSLPVVFLRWTLKNTSSAPTTVSLEGFLENASVKQHAEHPAIRRRVSPVEAKGGVIAVGEVVSADGSRAPQGTLDRRDFGGVALALIGAGSFTPRALATISTKQHLTVATPETTLTPGESKTFTFVVAWHFPHAAGRITHGKGALPDGRRRVAEQFADIAALARHAVERSDDIIRKVTLFRDTWYGAESSDNRGTLPHWLLERALWTVTTLTTNDSYRLAGDRFWAWEGVGACEGTCTHVWHYAQTPGRLFPEIERQLRENTDFRTPAMRDDGSIDFRGGMAGGWAIDGQAGVVLRSWRQHCTDTTGTFLKKNWESVKKTTRFLIAFDAGKKGKPDGMPTGSAHNTLDANWSGAIPWFASIYNAALIAAAAMADELGDKPFADECRSIVESGRKGYAKLFDPAAGHYVSDATPKEMLPIHIGKGSHIDMALGDWWLAQTGLPAFGDRTQLRSSMNALFENNFVPDMGAFRRRWKKASQRGRPYALDGEAGLVMCTWPRGGLPDACRHFWSFGYFQECMSGFEHAAAGLMVSLAENEADPLLGRGLAVTRAVHERYAAHKRNPYNEVECSDHYARAMSSYGVFVAACGFHTHEPSGLLRFEPKLSPGEFAAPFVTGGGWGRYTQKAEATRFVATLETRHGSVKTTVLEMRPGARTISNSVVTLAGTALAHRLETGVDGRVRVVFREPAVVDESKTLTVVLRLA